MNIYDFDKTVYDGDSTVHFCIFSIGRRPLLLIEFIKALPAAAMFALGKKSKTEFKQKLYAFLKKIPDIDTEVECFWKAHEKNVKAWYLEQKREDDLIISASPEFLLGPECKKLKIDLIASRVDKKTGKYEGINCSGEEKVCRLRERYPQCVIDEFYSDSHSDDPLARAAEKAFMVKGDKRTPWSFES